MVAGLQRGSRLIGLAAASLDQRLQLRAVEIATHDAHALAVAPVELAALLIENDLLRGVGVSLRDNCLAVLSVDVGPLDGPVIQVWDAHVGPVDMACFNVHEDAVRQMTARHNGRVIRAVRIHQMNATRIQFENEEAWDCDLWGRARDGLLHIAPAFLARQRTGRVSATMTRSPAFGLARNITAGMLLLDPARDFRPPRIAPVSCVRVARSMDFGQRLAGTTCTDARGPITRRSTLFRSAVLTLPPKTGRLSRGAA
jgi:hypothetical protein